VQRPTAACPNPVQMAYGTACKCDGESCGSYPDAGTLRDDEALIITSRGAAEAQGSLFFDPEVVSVLPAGGAPSQAPGMQIDIDPTRAAQTILGFGGAVTDAVAYHYTNMDERTQKQFIRQYFGPEGIGYTVSRVPMNAADFSRMNYVLDDVPGDYDLEHFCLRDDSAREVPCGQDYKATVLKAAQDAVNESEGDRLKLFVSSWSPPLWYKDQNFTCQLHNGFYRCLNGASNSAMQCTEAILNPETCVGQPIGKSCPREKIKEVEDRRTLQLGINLDPNQKYPTKNAAGNCYNTGFLKRDPRTQASWALFFSKFIDAYRARGVDIWGLTVQNEPLATVSLWQAMYYTPEMQAEFVVNYLGPLMRAKYPDLKIMIYDDGLVDMLEFADRVLSYPGAAAYVDGVGYHWYTTVHGTYENAPPQRPLKFVPSFLVPYDAGGGSNVRKVLEKVQVHGPEKFVMMTEACAGFVLQTGWVGPRPGEWGYGYAYSHDIMWQLRNGAAGWTDWNIMLGMDGGPNLQGNFVDSPILFKPTHGHFYKNPMFFHMAHYSKYILPGSKRVELNIECSATREEYCQAVGFLRPDGKAVVVITNDEITAGPLANGPMSQLYVPPLAKGQGSGMFGENRDASLYWKITCGESDVSGSIPWKGIQTVVFSCNRTARA